MAAADAKKAMTDAHNRIVQFHNDRDQAAAARRPKNFVLYHYTTADGLKGIIENDELWATSAYYLNDPTEIMYGYQLIDEALEAWRKKANPPENCMAGGLVYKLQRQFGHDYLKLNIITPVYLTCFCEEDNLLSQWRAYSQSGGYSIGFHVLSEGTVYGLKPEPSVYSARCVKVEYDRGEQLRRITELLDFLVPVVDDPEVTEAIRSLDPLAPDVFGWLSRTIAEILMDESVAFKNPAFAVEKEWRLVVRSRELLKQGTDDGDHTNLPICFRTARGQLTPYVRLIPSGTAFPITGDGQKLPIQSVHCGPVGDRVSTAMAVNRLLDRYGYRGVRVIALRFRLHSDGVSFKRLPARDLSMAIDREAPDRTPGCRLPQPRGQHRNESPRRPLSARASSPAQSFHRTSNASPGFASANTL